jgi:hypothetical protein
MKPDSKSTTFRHLAQQLRDGCERRGIQLDDGAAEIILADRVNAVANKLRVTDHHAMRSYFTDDMIEQIVGLCERERTQQQAEIELASPMLLPIPHAATIIGALAASCQAATIATHRTDTTIAVHEATAAILRIAGAIARAGDTGCAILNAATAVIASTQLSTMVECLTDGTWHMPDHERLPDNRGHDLAMRDRIAHDLELLQ